MVHPDRVCTNAGARPGDRLFLTKPLGMGPVTTAYRKRAISEEHMRRAGEMMAVLNKGACEAMASVGINEPDGVHAATDVTGFGLIGHAANLAEGSGVTLVFRAGAVPVFEGALEFAAQNMVTGALSRNEALLKDRVEVGSGVGESLRRVVYDAETSGGLLVAVAEEGADRLRKALADRAVSGAAEVGRVEARNGALLRLE
jgi:selenide,water dikinase